MPIDPDAVGRSGEPVNVTWTSTDSLIYALGVGAGATDPTGSDLPFTTENSATIEQHALPTQVVVLRGGGPEFGTYDSAALLHAEQQVQLHQTVPAEGQATCTTTVEAVYDKGKAALVYLSTAAVDPDGQLMWTSRMGVFIRGEGGWGGDSGPASTWAVPERDADRVISLQTRLDQALIYRLSGDRNPLHSDPQFASRAGFDKPILHGLCTFGFTGRGLLEECVDGDVNRFGSMSARFRSPVYPGERLDLYLWQVEEGRTHFLTRVDDRVVLDFGVFGAR
jgi:acyl dehydratase